ncbi:MAG: 23S rRNA (guanosine(2251)-2'-O)-methyltransferase RlmB [Saccharofermentans sp.]|nr:23S rRNA (guanosine(2251)-2'-O)-methyltransferase RlmB [Saccharofermentans sp.]
MRNNDRRDYRRDNRGDDRRNESVSVPSGDKLEGRNAVTEALKAGREINKLWILDNKDGKKIDSGLARIVNMAYERKIVVVKATREVLNRMSETNNHQGVIASVACKEYVEIDDILAQAQEKGHAPLLVVLDELKDAYNLGSVLRIADAAGVDGVVIPKHRSIGLDSVVAKASAGAIEYVPVARVTNIANTLRDLKKNNGFWVCGTDALGQTPYDKADYSGPMAIVIGSEGEGMRDLVRKECDFLLSIPMAGEVNSLNAAVAAGIVIFEAVKGRKA